MFGINFGFRRASNKPVQKNIVSNKNALEKKAAEMAQDERVKKLTIETEAKAAEEAAAKALEEAAAAKAAEEAKA